MTEEPSPAEAAQALADVQPRQQQVTGAGGPVLLRRLRAIMLGNRTGAAR
jgi:hypothetical protein